MLGSFAYGTRRFADASTLDVSTAMDDHSRLRVIVTEPESGVARAAYGDTQANNPVTRVEFQLTERGCGSFKVVFNAAVQDLPIRRGDRVDIHVNGSYQPWYCGRVETLPAVDTSFGAATVSGYGYAAILDGVIVEESYAATRVDLIVQDLMETYLPGSGIDATAVPLSTVTVEEARFDRTPLSDALGTLAELAGNWTFYVDEFRRLFFRPREGRPNLQFRNASSLWVGPHLETFSLAEKSTGVKNRLYVKIGATTTEGNFSDFVAEDLASIAFFGQREDVVSAPDLTTQSDAETWGAYKVASMAWPTISAKGKNINIRAWTKSDMARPGDGVRVSMPRQGLAGAYYEPVAGYYRPIGLAEAWVYGSIWLKRHFTPRLSGDLGRVSVLCRADGNPGALRLTVRNMGTGQAVGTAAATPSAWIGWLDFSFAGCRVTASNTYALELSAPDGDIGNRVAISASSFDAPYSGGLFESSNSGGLWVESDSSGICYRAELEHKDQFILSVVKADYRVGPDTGAACDLDLGALDEPLAEALSDLLRGLKAAELLTQANAR